MTKVMKQAIRPPVLLLLLLLAAGTVQAGLTMLPDSSYFNGSTSTIFKSLGNGKFISGRLEYTVYDTQANPDEFTGLGGATAPGSGRYLYAYQLFLNSSNAFGAAAGIDYFAINGISKSVLDNATIGYTIDGAGGGQTPTAYSFSYTGNDDDNKAIWDFSEEEIAAGSWSVFLLFRSDYTPQWTTFDVVRQDSGDVVGPEIPEPVSLLLLSAGVAFLRRRRR